MNVFSAFDGYSAGQQALKELGLTVDNYFASEIDKYAISITQKNFPNTKQLGDIRKINGSDLPQIDLFIGGSPCQGFSVAGNQLNFSDPRSVLFFEYVRLLKEIKPKYFLLENVKMKKEFKDVISNHLGVEPIEINSALVSAQQRKRLYWTNIPNIEQPKDKQIYLNSVLETEQNNCRSQTPIISFTNSDNAYFKSLDDNQLHYRLTCKYKIDHIWTNPNKYKTLTASLSNNDIPVRIGDVGSKSQGCRVYSVTGKSVCLMAAGGGLGAKTGLYKIDLPDGDYTIRKLTPIECERLQTLPDNYTAGVSNSQRYKMLGNGWTVSVIKHIFKNMSISQ